MEQPTAKVLAFPQESSEDVLTTVLRDGARNRGAVALADRWSVQFGPAVD